MKAFRGGPGLVYVRCLLGFSRQVNVNERPHRFSGLRNEYRAMPIVHVIQQIPKSLTYIHDRDLVNHHDHLNSYNRINYLTHTIFIMQGILVAMVRLCDRGLFLFDESVGMEVRRHPLHTCFCLMKKSSLYFEVPKGLQGKRVSQSSSLWYSTAVITVSSLGNK